MRHKTLGFNEQFMLVQKGDKNRITLTLWDQKRDEKVFEQLYHVATQYEFYKQKRDEALKLFA